jgi:hypothetical protein
MKLHANIFASDFDEYYEMAILYCFDKANNYCFSLTRFPDSEEIEVMVLDQINYPVNDLSVVLNPESIEVLLNKEDANNLDGTSAYTISFDPRAVDIIEMAKALEKIFDSKQGFKNNAF